MELGGLAIVDQHAHPVLSAEVAAMRSWRSFLTEAVDPEAVEQAGSTLFVQRSVRDMAVLLGCGATEIEIVEARRRQTLEDLGDICFRAADIEAVLLDDGLDARGALPISWHQRLTGVRRILRLEALAERLLEPDLPFETFVDRFRAELDPPGPDVVALKTIAAYRCGLHLEGCDEEEAREAYHRWLRRFAEEGGRRRRLVERPLICCLVRHAFDLAARHGQPVQIHCGLGDPDLDLREANPLHLRPMLVNPRLREVPVVLLHACWPFTREGAYLAAVYPQVHLDLGLAIPFLSVRGMREALGMMLEVAPASKILYSSDASRVPDLFYLGSRWGRRVLGSVLEGAVRDGDLEVRQAEVVARAILHDNACRLYRLEQA